MSNEIEDAHLLITIKNKEPLELTELTKALVCLGNQFNTYSATHGLSPDSRLYIREIKTGSIILDLVDLTTASIIPFLGHVSTVVKFAEHLKKVANYFLKKEGEKPTLASNDYKELSTILNPAVRDSGSIFNVTTVINGNPTVYLNVNSVEANALQNKFKQEIKDIALPVPLEGVKERVLFYWSQAKSDINSKTGDKGIIESIAPNELKVIFGSDGIKEQMIKGETNPFTHAFVVDVTVDTVKGKPTVYKILKVHEIIDAE